LIIRTLQAMADVYRLSTTGGQNSPRFKRYVEIMREEGVPAHGYNPMTSKPALETVEALLAIDAEAVAEEFSGDHDMYITVATPGMWTDRISTEIDHRLAPTNWSGGPAAILLWTGEDTSVETVRRETIAQVVRLERDARTTFEVAMREGYAYALSGDEGSIDDDVASALDVVGSDEALATKAALLYGDDVARTMGFVPLGLAGRAGYRHCIALHQSSGAVP
jgi:hypothetical protein